MQELEIPFKHFQLVASFNGLFCLSNARYSFILWNPSIKKYVSLPKPRVRTSLSPPVRTSRSDKVSQIVLGFGFDCKTDDYKVLRIAYSLKEEMYVGQVEIYSVKSGSWKDLYAGAPFPYYIPGIYAQTFVEGCLHWKGYNSTLTEKSVFIVSFDMSNEVFKEVNLADDMQNSTFACAVLGEKLAAIESHSSICHTLTVWVMEEYGMVESWRKMYDVVGCNFLDFVGFTCNGDALIRVENNDLALYDSNDRSIKHVGVRGARYSFRMEMYMETLLLLNGKNAIKLRGKN